MTPRIWRYRGYEMTQVRDPKCEHESASGISQRALSDPSKVWLCDGCGYLYVSVPIVPFSLHHRSSAVEDRLAELADDVSVANARGDAWREQVREDTVELERLRSENLALVGGLRLVNSMPVVPNDERLGYDCAGCGVPLQAVHLADCPWAAAMRVLRPESVDTESQ